MADRNRFLANLLVDDASSVEDMSDELNDWGLFILDGYDSLMPLSVCMDNPDDMSIDLVQRPTVNRPHKAAKVPREIALENDGSPCDFHWSRAEEENEDHEENGGPNDIPKGKSIAHNHIKDGKVVFLSFDVETGGEQCGIVQISAQVFRFPAGDFTSSKSKTPPSITIPENAIFDEYVKPHPDAVWSSSSTQVHGLSPTSPEIQHEEEIEFVWP